MTKKLHFICGQNSRARDAYDRYTQLYRQCDAEDADVIVVLGGDGVFLRTVHEHLDNKKDIKHRPQFFGINYGNVGFFLNKHDSRLDLLTQISSAKCIPLSTLRVQATDYEDKTVIKYALNDCYILRHTTKLLRLKLRINGTEYIPHFYGDGIIMANPVGTTAYNRSAGGRILPLSANLISITPICAMKPSHWNGALITNDSSIEMDIENPKEYHVNLYVDNTNLGPIKHVKITQDPNYHVDILMKNDQDLEYKLLNEQFYNCCPFDSCCQDSRDD